MTHEGALPADPLLLALLKLADLDEDPGKKHLCSYFVADLCFWVETVWVVQWIHKRWNAFCRGSHYQPRSERKMDVSCFRGTPQIA